jgi:hypothetical protein
MWIIVGLGLFVGGATTSVLLAGCSCAGADTQGNGITPIPIPGCSAGADSDGGYYNRPDGGASDVAPSPDVVAPRDAAADLVGPPADTVVPADLAPPPPPADASPSPDLPDGGADTADAAPDIADGGDGGDLGPDAPDGGADGPVDVPPSDVVDGPPADLTGAG